MGFAMLPINGISEPELSSILNSNQCNIWNNRDEQVLMSGIWPGIQQLHLGRISEEEAAAQAKKAAK
jgi:hypothetical protein